MYFEKNNGFFNMDQKPREKLAFYGPQKLEDHELLEIILGRGTRKENIFQISERLLKNFQYQELLCIKNVQEFQKIFQLGFVQTCQLIATFELGRRFFQKELPGNTFRSSDEIYERVKDMSTFKKEYTRGLYLNTRYRLIHDEILTIGSLDGNIIHPREIFRPAIEYGAYAVILAHNHPSGDPTPSKQDLTVTQSLMAVGNLLQIPLLDHLIIGKDHYVSLNRLQFKTQ